MNRINKTLIVVIGLSIILVAGTILYLFKSWFPNNQDKGLLDFYSNKGKQIEVILEPDISSFLLDNCNINSQAKIKSVIEELSSNEKKKITLANFYEQYQHQYKSSNVNSDFDSVLANYNFEHNNNDETLIALSRLIDDNLIKTVSIINKRLSKTDLEDAEINLNKSKQRIELKVDHVNRMHEFIQFISNQANLNFWETYSQQNLSQKIIEADSILAKALLPIQKEEISKPTKVDENSDTISMDALIKQNEVNEEIDHSENISELEKQKHPIRFYLLGGFETPIGQTREFHDARISYVRMSDTQALNKFLNDDRVRKIFPSDLVFMYGPAQDDVRSKNLDLLIMYAIKISGNGFRPILNGKHLIHVSKGKDPITDNSNIQLEMDQYGSQVWERMTRNNINKPIAIAIDNMILSAPAPTEAITGGRSSITGSFSEKEIDQLVGLLQWGALPIKLHVRKEHVN